MYIIIMVIIKASQDHFRVYCRLWYYSSPTVLFMYPHSKWVIHTHDSSYKCQVHVMCMHCITDSNKVVNWCGMSLNAHFPYICHYMSFVLLLIYTKFHWALLIFIYISESNFTFITARCMCVCMHACIYACNKQHVSLCVCLSCVCLLAVHALYNVLVLFYCKVLWIFT